MQISAHPKPHQQSLCKHEPCLIADLTNYRELKPLAVSASTAVTTSVCLVVP